MAFWSPTPSPPALTRLPPPFPQCPLTFTGEWYKCHWFSSVPRLFSLLSNKSHTVSSTEHLLCDFLGIITKCKVTGFINSRLPIICTHFGSVAHAKQGHLLQPSQPLWLSSWISLLSSPIPWSSLPSPLPTSSYFLLTSHHAPAWDTLPLGHLAHCPISGTINMLKADSMFCVSEQQTGLPSPWLRGAKFLPCHQGIWGFKS